MLLQLRKKSGFLECLLHQQLQGVWPLLLILFPPRLILIFETKNSWLGSKASFFFLLDLDEEEK